MPLLYRFGPFELDPAEVSLCASLAGDRRAVALTRRAFDTLHYLVAHPGRLVGRDELLAAVWGDAIVEGTSTGRSAPCAAPSRWSRLALGGTAALVLLVLVGMVVARRASAPAVSGTAVAGFRNLSPGGREEWIATALAEMVAADAVAQGRHTEARRLAAELAEEARAKGFGLIAARAAALPLS